MYYSYHSLFKSCKNKQRLMYMMMTDSEIEELGNCSLFPQFFTQSQQAF